MEIQISKNTQENSPRGPRNTGIYRLLSDVPSFLITSICIKFLALPESLAAPLCLGQSSGHESLAVYGMGRGEGKRTKTDEAKGTMPTQCFLTKVFTSL